MSTFITPDIQAKLTDFLFYLNRASDKEMRPYVHTSIVGTKYIKVLQFDWLNNTRSAHSGRTYCFIDKINGSIYKPATKHLPAVGMRGSILDTKSYRDADIYGKWLYKIKVS